MPPLASLPMPPIAAQVDPTLHLWATMLWGAVAAAGLVFGIVDWLRTGQPRALLLFVGGGMMMLFEGMVDILGGCWFPANSWIAVTLFGRPLPVWLCLAYFAFFGFGISLAWRAFARGVTRRQLWSAFVFGMVADMGQEVLQLNLGIYHYYGNQPLVVAMFPLWWAPVNALIALMTAAVCFVFDAELRGARQWLIIPIALCTSAAINCAVGWPSWLVINTPTSWALTQIGGLATFALAFWLMSMLVRIVAIDVPETRRPGMLRFRPAAIPA